MRWFRKSRKQMTRAEYLLWVREQMAEFVGAMRALLNDADNYVEMRFECPDTGETFFLRVQRAKGLTPHQARVAAEQERDRLREENAELREDAAIREADCLRAAKGLK